MSLSVLGANEALTIALMVILSHTPLTFMIMTVYLNTTALTS